MSQSKSPVGTSDARAFLQQAFEAPSGARILFEDKGSATHFMMRCNNVRALDRKNNKKIYTSENPMFNASIFDGLSFRVVEWPPGLCTKCKAELIGPHWALVAIKDTEGLNKTFKVETF